MKLDYKFKDRALFERAMTHSSHANENKRAGEHSNERLEFLGDAVLGMICAEFLYKAFPKEEEGQLTRLRASIVCEKSLYGFAVEIGLGNDVRLGKGEDVGGGRERPSVLSDAVEALIAAVYLDGGLEEAKNFILPFISREAKKLEEEEYSSDYKTTLQEIVQKNKEEILTYRFVNESGPDHDKWFEVEVLINSNVISKGTGKSKRQAEQEAARAALKLMGK